MRTGFCKLKIFLPVSCIICGSFCFTNPEFSLIVFCIKKFSRLIYPILAVVCKERSCLSITSGLFAPLIQRKFRTGKRITSISVFFCNNCRSAYIHNICHCNRCCITSSYRNIFYYCAQYITRRGFYLLYIILSRRQFQICDFSILIRNSGFNSLIFFVHNTITRFHILPCIDCVFGICNFFSCICFCFYQFDTSICRRFYRKINLSSCPLVYICPKILHSVFSRLCFSIYKNI